MAQNEQLYSKDLQHHYVTNLASSTQSQAMSRLQTPLAQYSGEHLSHHWPGQLFPSKKSRMNTPRLHVLVSSHAWLCLLPLDMHSKADFIWTVTLAYSKIDLQDDRLLEFNTTRAAPWLCTTTVVGRERAKDFLIWPFYKVCDGLPIFPIFSIAF